jgi:hypothetical protein
MRFLNSALEMPLGPNYIPVTLSILNCKQNVYGEFCLLRYNAMWSGECQLTYQMNILSPSSALKSKQSKKVA